ncbi:MAG: hypothetical protein R3B82_09050 [Sandaracinaceae bacterium]
MTDPVAPSDDDDEIGPLPTVHPTRLIAVAAALALLAGLAWWRFQPDEPAPPVHTQAPPHDEAEPPPDAVGTDEPPDVVPTERPSPAEATVTTPDAGAVTPVAAHTPSPVRPRHPRGGHAPDPEPDRTPVEAPPSEPDPTPAVQRGINGAPIISN